MLPLDFSDMPDISTSFWKVDMSAVCSICLLNAGDCATSLGLCQHPVGHTSVHSKTCEAPQEDMLSRKLCTLLPCLSCPEACY